MSNVEKTNVIVRENGSENVDTGKTEFVWKEYFPGDEDELCKATAGTGWLTEDIDTAKTMLGNDDEYTNSGNLSKALLLFMHSKPAVVIFFDEYGHIDSISGTGRGESVSGSAIEEVRKELTELSSISGATDAMTMLGCWESLYSMEVKMSEGQPLSMEDLKFLFEIEETAPIDLDDTISYKGYDGGPLREYYKDQAKKMGILSDAQYELLSFAPFCMSTEEASEKFVYFLNDTKVNKELLFSIFSSKNILNGEALSQALKVNEYEEEALSASTPQAVADNLSVILALKKQELTDMAMSLLSREYVSAHLLELIEKGMKVEVAVKKAHSKAVARNFKELRRLGADINVLAYRLDQWVVDKNYQRLIKLGADKNLVLTRMSSDMILRRLGDLVNNYKIDRSRILSKLSEGQIFRHLKILHEVYGFDVNTIIPKLTLGHIRQSLKYLVKNGATVNALLKKRTFLPMNILDLKDKLTSYGLKINFKKVIKKIKPDVILYRLDDIMPLGVDLDLRKIARKAPLEGVRENAYALIHYGVSRQFIAGLLGDPSYLKYDDEED